MRHNQKKYTLVSKQSGSRRVIRNLATSLFMFDKVTTTRSKAKATQRAVDRLISFAKKNNTSNAIRNLKAFVYTEEASKKVLDVLIERYKDRPSGFTTLRRKGFRKGDGAEIFELSLIE